MVKVNNKILSRFLEIMEDYGEFIFGSKEEIKQQLQTCLNFQGYWSGCAIRVFYDKQQNDFYVESRF